jgi:cytochrome c oxidase subunit 3
MSDAGRVAEQFDDRSQQKTAAELGMWVFLGTEVLFFGGLFLSYALYRHIHAGGFEAAGRETKVLIGSINTGILLTSSATVALAVKAAKAEAVRLLQALIAVTIALGVVFLALKLYEYHEDIREHLIPGSPLFPIDETGAQIFFSLYWVMTGIHAVHMLAGIGTWSAVMTLVQLRRIDPARSGAVEVAGLYWHFVDIIWIFLYPLLYLVGRS